MTTGEPILAGLRRLMRAGRPLDLLNLYKGVPIVYRARVGQVDDEQATLQIPSFEIVCLTVEPTTILLSQLLEEAVSARVVAVDLRAGTATLSQFQYASSHVGDRMTVRVAPRSPVEVRLEHGEQSIPGRLTDLSINGLGVHLPAAQAAAIRPRAVVRLELALPDQADSPLSVSGTVRFVRTEGEATRVGIVFVQDLHLLTILHYVRDRQAEILDELRALHQSRQPAS